ncbi:MAG: imidazole glycerol phosphate synthase subunit HisH [Anaerolineales bacterium]
MTTHITLIDAGTGNLRSVLKALESLGAQVTLTDKPELVRQARKLVLPGVGAFGDFMKGLRSRQLEQVILEKKAQGFPLLGICVGMQAFFERGLEMGEHAGLGLLAGQVQRFPDTGELKIPHTGWNQLWPVGQSPLLKDIQPGDYAYFNHSYYCAPGDVEDVILFTDYGIQYASAVQKDNLYGVQFHPEKSQRVGLQVLANFLQV